MLVEIHLHNMGLDFFFPEEESLVSAACDLITVLCMAGEETATNHILAMSPYFFAFSQTCFKIIEGRKENVLYSSL